VSERSNLSERLAGARGEAQPEAPDLSYLQRRLHEAISTDAEAQAKYALLRDRVRDKLLEEIDPNKLFRPHDRVLMQEIGERISQILERDEVEIPALARREYAVRLVQDIVGFGPIQPLIDDQTVTEVLVNRWNDIWVERNGRLEQEKGVRFDSDLAIRDLAERIALPLRRRIDERHPILDARLPDGSRVCATLSPPALDGCAMAIRKFNKQMIDLEGLKRVGTLTDETVEFLRQAVRARASILVVGGTSCGKTTVLNALSSLIPRDERIITIEDAAELQLQQPHVLRYETKQGNAEGKGAISIRDLVRTSLRLRPDRIVVGEVRGPEALDMIQANNTGHDGGFSTLHANSARDGLSRLETLVLMADSGLPLLAIRQQIGSAFDLIISCLRLRDGRRRLAEIAEINGVQDGQYRVSMLYQYDPATDRLQPTGVAPDRLAHRFRWSGEGGG
jgi:pilus assembly protein CpaF